MEVDAQNLPEGVQEHVVFLDALAPSRPVGPPSSDRPGMHGVDGAGGGHGGGVILGRAVATPGPSAAQVPPVTTSGVVIVTSVGHSFLGPGAVR